MCVYTYIYMCMYVFVYVFMYLRAYIYISPLCSFCKNIPVCLSIHFECTLSHEETIFDASLSYMLMFIEPNRCSAGSAILRES